jgi:hypothetical protein
MTTTRRGRALILAILVISLLVAIAAPAWASHEVEFRIVGFGDQDCRSGSTKLINRTASPFTVEACVTLDGAPLAGHEMTVRVTHGDGSVEEAQVTTDAEGKFTVRVNPIAAGTTTVELCDADGCDYGSVSMEADNQPRPPAEASYFGPTTDVGPTEPIADGAGDFIDAYTADAAAEDPGEQHRAGDLASFRYLGTREGIARFEFTTRGDICSVFENGAPLAQLSARVTTPDGGRYTLVYQYRPDGSPLAAANSDGAPLDGVTVTLEEWVDASTGVLAASGVDVPAGSTIAFEVWLSFEPTSSGYWDTVEGTATPAPPPAAPTTTAGGGPGPTETTSGSAATTTAAPATTTTLAGGGNTEGGSFSIVIPVVILGLVVGAFVIYYRTRERAKTPGPGAAGGGDDDDGDDPRDTPPPAVYGEHAEHPGCGWGLYWIDMAGAAVPLREPGGAVHVCCKYFIHLKTSADSSVVAQVAQDGTTDRLRIPAADREVSDVRLEARAGTRSGPADSLGWMQGLGNPTDQAGIEAGDFDQEVPWERPPEVVARLRHGETTSLAVTLEAGCPEYDHRYELEGVTDMAGLATHECTNDAGDPCPVELFAIGSVRGAIRGPGRFRTSVKHRIGGATDDTDSDDPSGSKPRVDHDHAEKDRVTHAFEDHQETNEVSDREDLKIRVRNRVRFDTAQIVPREVWPTTERVTASAEAMLTHEVTVDGSLDPKGCDANGCCGHGTCDCRARFQVSLSRLVSAITVDGKAYTVERRPKPIGESEFDSWDLIPPRP